MQHNWAYTSSSGRQYVVGLYHGQESGHLMVYCDLRIIRIEFGVLDTYMYSFFIEDELLELKIERQGTGFKYLFEVNRQVDTPRNRARKIAEKSDFQRLILLILLGIVMLIAGIWVWRYNEVIVPQRKEQEWLRQAGSEAVARVFLSEQKGMIRYAFVADARGYEREVPMHNYNPDHGMPLEHGDEFLVRYASNRPVIHKIDFNAPTDRQLRQYRQRAAAQHLLLHPNTSPRQLDCLLDVALELEGTRAYAHFFFQNTPPEENPLHNRNTFGRLTRSLPFLEATRQRCAAF